MSRLALLPALAAALACACSGRTSAGGGSASASASAGSGPVSTPARAPGPITVRDPGGAVIATVELAAGSCKATLGGATISVARAGDALTVAGTAAPIRVERTPAGDQLVQGDARVARVWRDPAEPGHVDVVGPDGMALYRFTAAGAIATITDAGSAPTGRVVFEGGRFVAQDNHDAVSAYVSGGDAELAALLTTPPLALDLRAVAACDRLLAPVTP